MPEPRPTRPVVCVQGLGFVGAAMAVAVASARDEHATAPRFDVIGIDLPTPQGEERIQQLNRGVFPFPTLDRTLQEATAAVRAAGNLHATSDASSFSRADIVIVDVHLDVDSSSGVAAVDFAPFRAALATVGAHLRPGTLVIVETTVPPGTCEHIAAPALARVLEARGLPGDAFLLAHSYERVMPGDQYLASITNFWRVYAGHTPAAADACERFLAQVINVRDYPLTRLASTTASEIAKILENSYRATNIAFIEEWGRLAEAVGVNLFAVVEAIRMRPTHNNIRQPGFGVGGYCLTKDPLLAGVAARQLFKRDDLRFPFSELAVQTNHSMPLASVDRLQDLLAGDLRGKRVALLGVSYRQDVGDTRYSPALAFVQEVWRRGGEVVLQDPLVTYWPELQLDVSAELPSSAEVDAVVFAVPHRAYRMLDLRTWLAVGRPTVLDANGVLTEAQQRDVQAAGCAFAAIGMG